MISIIILTKNEQSDLPSCLNSVAWCDDIHVVDSGSSDKTVEIAVELGAKVYLKEFKSFALQRNWALDNCKLNYEWVLFLDDDVVIEPDSIELLYERYIFNTSFSNYSGFGLAIKNRV